MIYVVAFLFHFPRGSVHEGLLKVETVSGVKVR